MTREFYLLNENGEKYSFMDLNNSCFLTDPQGLGVSYTYSYEAVGDTYVNYSKLLNQNVISGTCNFKNYDNYKKLIDFIEKSKELKLIYKIPIENESVEYQRNIILKDLSKTEIKTNNILSCNISFDTLSLWYTEQIYTYKIEPESDTIRWNFKWPSKWMNYNTRKITFNNEGHTEAPFLLKINGVVENPKITVFDSNNNQLYSIQIPILISTNEKFIYSSIDNNLMIAKETADGTIQSLFTQDYIDITNNNIFKLPVGESSISISAEQDVEDAILTIYPYYKSV